MRRTDLISLPPRRRHHADPERGVVATARCPVAGRTGVVSLIRLEVAWRRSFELDDEDDDDLCEQWAGWSTAGASP